MWRGRPPNRSVSSTSSAIGKLSRGTTELRLAVPPNNQPSAPETALSCEETRITAKISIRGKIVTATIDTGTTRNFISVKLVDQLQLTPQALKTDLKVMLADGSKKQITQVVESSVTLGNLSKHCKFLLMPGCSEDFILGLEFLRSFGATLICDGLQVKYETSRIITNDYARMNTSEPMPERTTKQYREGKQNVVNKGLSRQPGETDNITSFHTPPKAYRWLENRIKDVRKQPGKYPEYSLINNQLYRHFSQNVHDDDQNPWKLCVDSPLRARVLEENHNVATAGHLGIRKTGHRIAARYYWPGMFRDISRYVRK